MEMLRITHLLERRKEVPLQKEGSTKQQHDEALSHMDLSLNLDPATFLSKRLVTELLRSSISLIFKWLIIVSNSYGCCVIY